MDRLRWLACHPRKVGARASAGKREGLMGMSERMVDRCPVCGSIGMDNCERVMCSWDRWDDGTRVTAKQREDGAAFAHRVNAWLAKRNPCQICGGKGCQDCDWFGTAAP